jgi:hypothetical protein
MDWGRLWMYTVQEAASGLLDIVRYCGLVDLREICCRKPGTGHVLGQECPK